MMIIILNLNKQSHLQSYIFEWTCSTELHFLGRKYYIKEKMEEDSRRKLIWLFRFYKDQQSSGLSERSKLDVSKKAEGRPEDIPTTYIQDIYI